MKRGLQSNAQPRVVSSEGGMRRAGFAIGRGEGGKIGGRVHHGSDVAERLPRGASRRRHVAARVAGSAHGAAPPAAANMASCATP